MDENIEFLKLIELLIGKYPQVITVVMAIVIIVSIYIVIAVTMFIIAFKKGYKISFWPISIDPQNSNKIEFENKYNDIYSEIVNIKESFSTIPRELLLLKDLVENNNKITEIFKYKIDHI